MRKAHVFSVRVIGAECMGDVITMAYEGLDWPINYKAGKQAPPTAKRTRWNHSRDQPKDHWRYDHLKAMCLSAQTWMQLPPFLIGRKPCRAQETWRSERVWPYEDRHLLGRRPCLRLSASKSTRLSWLGPTSLRWRWWWNLALLAAFAYTWFTTTILRGVIDWEASVGTRWMHIICPLENEYVKSRRKLWFYYDLKRADCSGARDDKIG